MIVKQVIYIVGKLLKNEFLNTFLANCEANLSDQGKMGQPAVFTNLFVFQCCYI